ncbi:arylsulfatase K isoform X2 [Dromiciops gliroides]|uniref:arylsulfatase K isoform X2 n=1 Tax=Dromiciops gliroides TaxID=33562 RepID=UPI001CC655E3|nr:arylsulfatase K isoform X2 [Dromiciops gliroides]
MQWWPLGVILLAVTSVGPAPAAPASWAGRLKERSGPGRPPTQRVTTQETSVPNVVLVVSDSFDGRLTFHPGNQRVALPFINFMKKHGTLFLNAYTNSPICCPSRAAMWSGLFTHLTESWNNFKGLDQNYTTWMDLLQKSGYHTQKFGKVDYTSGHHSISNRVEAWTRDVHFLLRQEGRPVVNLIPDKRKARIMEEDWQNTDKATNWLRKEAINFTQPFVLYLGLNLPHPYPSPETGENFGSSTFQTSLYWLEKVFYKAIKIPKWSPLSEMHPVDYYSSYTKNCTGQFTEKEIRDIRAFYYAMCAETDAMLGEIILTLYQLKLLQKTVVIFTSDHDIAGVPLHKNLSGYSLIPLSSEAVNNNSQSTRPHPPWILSEFHGCNVNASTYMLRIDKWKYIAYSDGVSSPPQLFDLSSDPDELTNIATRFPEITHSLDQKLRSIINYPVVSASVHQYNKKEFISWKDSLGRNYTKVIANLRWHQDWLKEPMKYESAINQWLKTDTNL